MVSSSTGSKKNINIVFLLLFLKNLNETILAFQYFPLCWGKNRRPILCNEDGLHPNLLDGQFGCYLSYGLKNKLCTRKGLAESTRSEKESMDFDAVNHLSSQFEGGMKVVQIECEDKSGALLDPSAVSDFLMEIGACSVTIEDAAEQEKKRSSKEPFNSEGEIDPLDYSWNDLMKAQTWSKPTVTAQFPEYFEDQMIINMITSSFELEKLPTIQMESQQNVVQTDWLEESKKQWEPITIGNVQIVFGYDGELQGSDKDKVNVRLIGGAGFGTGGHPTTFMCIKWLQTVVQPGYRVLDYGSGSGVLGLTALKLGATQVDGVDIDIEAIQASYQNAILNEVSMDLYYPRELTDQSEPGTVQVTKVSPQYSDQLDLNKTHDWVSLSNFPPYNLIIANVLPSLLLDVVDTFESLLKPGGKIALSGITASQATAVLSCYQNVFQNVQILDTNDGYVLITGEKDS